jgi:NADPH-dependent glutamate synthase beta subunit-like oxidoreductase
MRDAKVDTLNEALSKQIKRKPDLFVHAEQRFAAQFVLFAAGFGAEQTGQSMTKLM